ncbi:MAG TPA: Uma2 family endonuclease [Sandaracinaceae bacterium LLY-WYZ-13_1]|nr:Uma2 family endonuclease [Sandaracinaceae bacterium LLY-WYZ-13_1]
MSSDQRVRVAETRAYVYPDVSVVCDDPRFADDRPPSLENPRLLVEVLSPTTEDVDRGAKLAHYRRMPSVAEVLLVDSRERRAELYRRLENGPWLIHDVLDGDLELASVGVTLSLDAIYAKTEGLPVEPVDDRA